MISGDAVWVCNGLGAGIENSVCSCSTRPVGLCVGVPNFYWSSGMEINYNNFDNLPSGFGVFVCGWIGVLNCPCIGPAPEVGVLGF